MKVWVEEWIEGIEDVTEKARRLKDVLDGDGDVGEEELVGMGLLPVEREYEVEGELARRLGMGSYGEDPDGLVEGSVPSPPSTDPSFQASLVCKVPPVNHRYP